MNADDPRHGEPAGYDAHRRDNETACTPCREAAATYEYDRRIQSILGQTRTVDGLGPARRIQALVSLGWTFGQIAEQLGTSHDWPRKVANQDGARIRSTTARRVAAVYGRLSMTLPPQATGKQRRNVGYAKAVAARYGWLPPLAWDDIDNDPEPSTGVRSSDLDPVVVMRLLQGDRVTASKAEKDAAMAEWIEQGGSQAELCRWHGWKEGRYGSGLRSVPA